ncbi:hypothetical protein ACH6EH_06655 [Paenibacillus sp. JSM ZJ436]|uniref:hypothetical protein n=1 Tax=Paenibacillus sp. JSM ZJ436 TaxID=3376190 RepID=UPI0037B2415F
MFDNQKLKALFTRVVNNKVEEKDHEDIAAYCKKVFGSGYSPDPSMLHQFNNLVVETADQIAKPVVTNLLSVLAEYDSVAPNTVKQYNIPQKNKAKVRWSANGSGVDMVRVEGKRKEIAVPQQLSTGFYYEPFGDGDYVEQFNKLVNDVADAKVRLYMDVIAKLVTAAVASGKIPNANVVAASNVTIQQYNKLASVLARYGGRPVFVADTLLIDHFAQQQATDTTIKTLLTDRIKEELLTSLNPSTIGRTTAMNLVNPFLDETNSKVELPVNVGYMFAGDVSQKPFVVTEFGGMRQMTEQDMEDERIKMKITQSADVQLIFGEAIGYIKDDNVAL